VVFFLQRFNEGDIAHILPFHLLTNLKELVFEECFTAENTWPESWRQLVELTKLKCSFSKVLPGFIVELTNLQVLDLKVLGAINLEELSPVQNLTGLSSLKLWLN
jgi:hypothetical protein